MPNSRVIPLKVPILMIARSARNKDMIVAYLQQDADKVVAWSDKAKLTLNKSKCETAYFSLECSEAVWQPSITRNVLKSLPGFLGCQIRPAEHTLAEHVQKLCQSMSGRFNLPHALGCTTWGWHTQDCRQVYIAIVCSMHEYAAAAWAPWLSATSTSKLERVQLEVARAITGLIWGTLAVSDLHQQTSKSSVRGGQSHHGPYLGHLGCQRPPRANLKESS